MSDNNFISPTTRSLCLLPFAAAVFLAFVSIAQAQQKEPHIGYVYPAGGRQGTTFQVTIGGQYLETTDNVYVTGGGVQAKVSEYVKPLTQKQVTDLREKVQELQKKPKDPDAIKEIAEIRKKLATFVRMPNPALAENVTLKITLNADAEPGKRELRIATANGLSNPLVFYVGHLPEFSKALSKPSGNLPIAQAAKLGGNQKKATPESEMTVTLPAMVNGQIMPGGVDRYRFKARRGQQIVAVAGARELIPFLADAVPGWFQAAIAIYDAQENELAYDDHYRFHPDPVISCKIPKDGEYVLEVRDSIYRGREDFVYRIALGELPFATSVFPLGGPVDAETSVDLKGWNLPVHKMIVDAKDKTPGVIPLFTLKSNKISNQIPFALDALPECLEQEPNNDQANAQQLMLPIIVNGRVEKPGNWNVFKFEGRAGQKIVAEVDARKLDSPLDSILKLTDGDGRQLAINDDFDDKGEGLSTHHADSLLTATLPADGKYYIYLGDAQRKGGPEYAYRLRISEPMPDFALRVVPSSVTIRAGMSVPITVYALRKDEFTDAITLTLKNVPNGFKLSGGQIPANKDQVRLTLTGPQTPLNEPVNIQLEGRARINGHEVLHSAVPAEDMMQAFIYRHIVPSQTLMASVIGRPRPRPPLRLLVEGPIKLPLGGTATVRFSANPGPMMNQIQLSLTDPPEGISIKSVSPTQGEITLILQTDAEKVKLGVKGNLIVEAFTERSPMTPDGKPAANKRRVSLGSLPAMAFEIVK